MASPPNGCGPAPENGCESVPDPRSRQTTTRGRTLDALVTQPFDDPPMAGSSSTPLPTPGRG